MTKKKPAGPDSPKAKRITKKREQEEARKASEEAHEQAIRERGEQAARDAEQYAREMESEEAEDEDESVAQNTRNVPRVKGKGKYAEDGFAELFAAVDEFVQDLSQKAEYEDMPPTDIAVAVFNVLRSDPGAPAVTQAQFAEHYGFSRRTFDRKQNARRVREATEAFVYLYYRKYAPTIMQSLVKGAQRTSWKTGLADVSAIKLFFQIVMKWSEKTEVDMTSKGESLMLGLPGSQFAKPDKIPKPTKK